MPVFDRSASRSGRAEADFLRGVLGPAKPTVTSFKQASRDFRRRQQRATVIRALVVFGLLGCFCGSAVVMTEPRRRPAEAAPAVLGVPPRPLFPAYALNTPSTSVEKIATEP
jgi:hypothetical protein